MPNTSATDSVDRYVNPYLAGLALGLVLLGTFLIAGRGLGVVGAVRTITGDAMRIAFPARIAADPFYADERTATPFADRYWIVFEVAGLMLGAWVSARLAGRVQVRVTRGAGIGDAKRLGLAAIGGAVMGFGAALARGCTSGLALTGGALLGVGSWVFMLALFAGGYLSAWFVRRQWT